MTYCSAAGLEDDSGALQARADPFKAACGATGSHQNKIHSGKAQMEHRGLEPCSQQCYDLSLLDCSAPSHNPQSVNHECTCTGLMRRSLARGCTLHSVLAWCDVAGEKCVFACASRAAARLSVPGGSSSGGLKTVKIYNPWHVQPPSYPLKSFSILDLVHLIVGEHLRVQRLCIRACLQ